MRAIKVAFITAEIAGCHRPESAKTVYFNQLIVISGYFSHGCIIRAAYLAANLPQWPIMLLHKHLYYHSLSFILLYIKVTTICQPPIPALFLA